MERLRQRADFLAVAGGSKAPAPAFILQLRARGDDGPARVGFTVSKKVGGAVERNRVRRRLREVVRRAAGPRMRPGTDYVLVGRRAALAYPFIRLLEDFVRVLEALHSGQRFGRMAANRGEKAANRGAKAMRRSAGRPGQAGDPSEQAGDRSEQAGDTARDEQGVT
jgi:ribonuclease P protein component